MPKTIKIRWREKTTLKFLKIYLAKECLWNPAHVWYKIKFKREKAYHEIVSEFKAITGKSMSIPEVKIKIKNLRSTYSQEVQKIMKKSSPDSIYQPSLVWFHDMDRCLKYVPTNRNVTADFSQEIEEVDLDEAEWLNQDRTYIEASNIEEENSKPLVPVLFLSDHNYGTVTQGSVVQVKLKVDSPEYSNSYIKHKRKKIKKPHYSIRSHIENWAKEDEFDIYGKYIASQLRKIELQRALEVQFQIQNLINKARASED